MAKRKSSVALCMIVRDEEASLAACLQSAQSYVDEICIVDTGSTDQTLAIAKSFGAKTKSITWPDDFAEARNHSLEMATSDWILVLDADEQLRPQQEAELAECVDNPHAIAAFQRVTNHGDEGKKVSCLILRLFRNLPSHRFSGAIHEQVINPVLDSATKLNLRVQDECLDIDHYGYTEALRVSKDKDARNRRHFERALEKDPEDAYIWFKFGDFLRRYDDQNPAIAALGRACAIIRSRSDQEVKDLTYCAEAFALRALELVRQGRHEEAGEDLAQTDRLLPTPMLYWVRGHYALVVGDFATAFEAFSSCHALDGKSVHVPAQPGITSGRSVFGMARALLGLKRQAEAIAAFEQGLRDYPDCADLLKACLRVRIAQRQFKDALAMAMDWLSRHPEEAEVWQAGAEVLMEMGVWERAETWAKRALEFAKEAEKPPAAALYGETQLGLGRIEEALELFQAGGESPQGKAGFAIILTMLGDALPAALTGDLPALRTSAAALIRRLQEAPDGTRILEILRQGAAQSGSLLHNLLPEPEPVAL